MELKHCKKHNAMTWHEKDTIVGWYCIKCVLDRDKKKMLEGL